MLQVFRQFSQSWIAKGFFLILVASFGVWGIADVFRGSVDTAVAHVGGEPIDQTVVQRAYDNAKRNLEARLGTALTPQQARETGLPKQVIEQLVNRKAVDLVTARLGLTASDDDVAQQIREVPVFQNSSGSFERNRFLEVLQQAHYTEAEFVEEERGAMERGQLLAAVTNGLDMPAGYSKAFFDFLYESRAVSYLTVPAGAAGAVPAPSDAELLSYVKQHADHFSTPEYRDFTYIAITPDSLGEAIQVTDQDLHTEYELHRAEYQVPEKRVVEQMQFPDEKSAKDAAAKLASGTSFEDLASTRGLALKDIQLGAVAQIDLGGDRGKAVFALKPGGTTAPIKGPLGYFLDKVTAINPGVNKTLDEVKPALIKEVRQKLAADKIGDIIAKLQDALAGGDTLAKAAQSVGMQAVHVKAMDAHAQAPDGSAVAIPKDPEFLAQVFKTDAGPAGDPFQTQLGNGFAIQVNGVTPPQLRPLAQVRDQAAKAWTAAKAQTMMADKVAALVAEANRTGSLDPVATALNAKILASPGLMRTTQNDTFPAALTQAIFDAAPGATVSGKTSDGANYVIARVTGIAHPPAEVVAVPQYRQFEFEFAGQVARDIPTSFEMEAQKKAGVSVNQKALDQISGNGQ